MPRTRPSTAAATRPSACAATALELELTVFVPPDQPAEIRLLTIRNHGTAAKRLRVVPYVEMALAELPQRHPGPPAGADRHRPRAFYFAQPGNDFHRGWAFVARRCASSRRSMSASASWAAPGRDLSRPYFVEHGARRRGAGDDGRRIASFAGDGRGAGRRRGPGGRRAGSGAGPAAAPRRWPSATRRWRWPARRWPRPSGSGPQPWATCGSRPTGRRSTGWSTTGCPTSCSPPACGAAAAPTSAAAPSAFATSSRTCCRCSRSQPGPRPATDPAARPASSSSRATCCNGGTRPPTGGTGLGARNHASDPHLWLPYLTARYVRADGDRAILDEHGAVPRGPPIPRRGGGHQLRAAAVARGGIALRALPPGDRLHA